MAGKLCFVKKFIENNRLKRLTNAKQRCKIDFVKTSSAAHSDLQRVCPWLKGRHSESESETTLRFVTECNKERLG